MSNPDAHAREYMADAYYEMQNGNSPAGFAGKVVAHVFDDCSDDLRRDVLTMIEDVDRYLASWTPPSDTHGLIGGANHYQNEIAFWRNHERPYYMRSKHAQINREVTR